MTDRSDLPSRHPDPLPWLAAAACRGMNPSLFFPEVGARHGYDNGRIVCGRCPVRDDCLAFALEMEGNAAWSGRAGMYGGMTPEERAEKVGSYTRRKARRRIGAA